MFWGRSVHVATPSGLDVFVGEYVKTPTSTTCSGRSPSDALMGMATDPVVLDPTGARPRTGLQQRAHHLLGHQPPDETVEGPGHVPGAFVMR